MGSIWEAVEIKADVFIAIPSEKIFGVSVSVYFSISMDLLKYNILSIYCISLKAF